MAKTQVKQSNIRRVVKRVKRNVQACLGVMCATLLLVAALPMPSDAVGEGAQDGPVQANPVVVEAPAATPSDGDLPDDAVVSDGASLNVPVSDVAPDEPAQEDSPMQPSSPQPFEGEASDPQPAEGDEPVQDGYEAPDADTTLDESGSLATGSDDLEAEEEGALAAAPLAADPAGFSWKFADIDADTCKINGYNGGTITSGTVHVPAVSPAGKKVVSIVSGSSSQFKDLRCQIDFSAAVNLQRIEQFVFDNSGLRGSIDLSGCANLVNIDAYSFRGSQSLTGVVLPPNVESIGNYAFYDSAAITGPLAFPKSLKKLGAEVFKNCKITSFSIPNDTALTTISAGTFENNRISGPLTLPARITTVQSSAFLGNQLTAVTFQANAIAVFDSAFRNNLIANNPLEGKTFTTLGHYAFAGNKLSGTVSFASNTAPVPSAGIIADNPDVTSVILSRYWNLVPNEMFKGLTALTSVSVPQRNSLRRIGERAFQSCVSLQSIDLNNAPLANDANGNAIGKEAFQGCTSLREVHVGTGAFGQQAQVTITVSNSAFKDCTALSFIDIPSPASGSTKISVRIGDKAFMNTNLGAFPNPLDPAQPLGYLPLDRRPIVSIGAEAFKNAGLEDVRLPGTLQSVGNEAFSDNHIPYLELPGNPALDAGTGTGILARQTVRRSALYGLKPMDRGAVKLGAVEFDCGVPVEHLTSVGLWPTGAGVATAPDNASWKTDEEAVFDRSALEAAGTAFSYDMEVWRKNGSGPLSSGSVRLDGVEMGVPYEFQYYNNDAFDEFDRTLIQWVGVGAYPREAVRGILNFGAHKPGYHTQPGAYDSTANAGWRWAGGASVNTPVNPAGVVAAAGESPSFYNRWIANSYSVTFDDNWEYLVTQDEKLGKLGPEGGPAIVRNDAWVSGTMDALPGLTYGVAASLPANGFRMGGYEFAGWATSPDLVESARVEGSNFFSPDSSMATPDPAPAEGGTVTLYAQWKAVDMGADDPALLGFLSIPIHVSLESAGGRLWSRPSASNADLGDHAVTVSAEAEAPGASWPSDRVYQVSVTRPSAGAPLLALSGGGNTRAIDVLAADNSVYDPGVNDTDDPGAVPPPLMTIDPNDAAKKAGSFMLRSVDSVSAFEANVRYAGTMTFRVDIVPTGVTP